MCNKSIFKGGAILIALSLVTLAACKRNDATTTTPALTSVDDNGGYATDEAKMERDGNDVVSIADNAAVYNTTDLRTTTYPTITPTYSGSDTVLTIDFGSTDHLCLDGRERRGQIIVSYSGHYKDSASTHTITSNNYYVDENELMVHKTVTNMGTNSSAQVWYNVTVNDTMVLANDSTISWTGNRTRTWLTGYNTSSLSDDSYAIGGTTSLTRANGHVFTCTISATDPLIVSLSCRWIEAGTMTISSTSFAGGDRTLNFTPGPTSGGCDDVATVTIGSHTYTIYMW